MNARPSHPRKATGGPALPLNLADTEATQDAAKHRWRTWKEHTMPAWKESLALRRNRATEERDEDSDSQSDHVENEGQNAPTGKST